MRGIKSNRWRIAFGYALAVTALAFASRYAAVNTENFTSTLRQISIGASVASLALFLLQIALNAIAFAYLNQAFGVTSDRLKLARIWSATLLAKYVPGGLWHVIGRGVVLARLGISARTTVLVGAVEQSISLLLCTLIAVIAFATTQPHVSVLIWIAGAVFLVGCALIAMRVARRFIDIMAVTKSLLLYAAAMIPYALGYFFLVSPSDPIRMLSALFAGTVAGILAVPMPGGLGVRESVASVLSAGVDMPRILIGFLAARAMILVAEVLASTLNVAVVRERG